MEIKSHASTVALIMVALIATTMVGIYVVPQIRQSVNPPVEQCPGLEIVIDEIAYDCQDGRLSILTQNSGKTVIEEFRIKATLNDVYSHNYKIPSSLNPGEQAIITNYNITPSLRSREGKITKIDVSDSSCPSKAYSFNASQITMRNCQ